jgi:PAS domain S-box-containing protein
LTETLSDGNDPEQKSDAQALADSAAGASIAGDNARFLQPLTVALLECTTPAEVVSAVVERGIVVLGARAGLVALITRNGDELEIVRTSGYAPSAMGKWGRFPVDGPYPLSEVVKRGEAVYLGNCDDWAAKYPALAGEIEDAFQASVSLPLAARQRVFGAMHFSFTELRGFTEPDRAFLDELARQCALALERALLLEAVEAARQHQEFLARASALLAESLDYQTTLDAIARLAVPDLCDWAAVDMVDPSNETGTLLNLAVAHADPAEVAWVREANSLYPTDMTQTGQPVVRAIITGETVFLPDIPEAVLLAAALDAEHLRLIRKLDLRSFLCVPLTARGRRLGAVTFASTRASGRIFTPETVDLVEELARRAAVAVDNARLYEQAQREARDRSEAERRFRVMADNAPVLIWTSGLDAACDWFNEPWLRFTGRTMEQEVGNGWADGVHPDDFDSCLKTYLDSFEARAPFTMEYRLRRNDGEYRWLLDNGVPAFDGDGTDAAFKGYIGSCVDIMEMKQAQSEQQWLVAELQEASLRQRRFLKEMLAGFTEGRLRLCFTAEELPAPLSAQSSPIELSDTALWQLRNSLEAVAKEMELPKERLQDLKTAVHEAGMNAVNYGGGGVARVYGDHISGTIQVWVEDNGPGIAEELIHRAIERGYTTGGFGHGMFFMQSCADRLYLLTSPTGTTVVLEQERTTPAPSWLQSEDGHRLS